MAHKTHKKRRLLTDRYLRSLPPAPRGKRVEVFDARLPCFGIRISDAKDADPARRGKAGKITFILYARFAPGAAPARRTIGIYGADAMRLEDARRIAGEWRSQVARGIDPAVVEAERRVAEARERALRVKHSFTIAAEAFIAAKDAMGPIPDLRRACPSWAFPLEMIPARPRLWGSRASTPVRLAVLLSEPTVGHGTGKGGSD